jgi:hypothetical protein
MNNPMQLMQMMKNPQAFLQQAMQSGNPIMKNAIEMYQRGDKDGINQLAQNLCKEKGTSYDDMVKQIKSQFGM